MNSDVVIVGGGFGGLVTAVRACELGLKVLVLESGDDEAYPCNSRYSGGNHHLGLQDVNQDPDVLIEHIVKITCGFVSTELASALAASGKRSLEWIRRYYPKFLRIGSGRTAVWMMAPPRQAKPGLQWKGRGPDEVIKALTQALLSGGGAILLKTRAIDLVMDDGICVGVDANQNGTKRRFNARAVVIADGGFQSNLELVGKYISPAPERLFQRGAGNGFGDGLLMCEKVGARLAGMPWFYGHPLSRDAFTNELLAPHPTLDPLSYSGIVVNKKAERFVDEGLGGVWLVNHMARLSDPLETMIIYDEDIWTGPAANLSSPPTPNPWVKNAGATIHSAPTIAELAQRAGIPADALEKTVAAYNGALLRAAYEDITPRRSIERFKAHPIRKPPFYALPICAGLTYTMGGPAVDGDARVLHRDGHAIGNLFAVGSSAGGFEGGDKIGYVGGISKAIILGLLAAERIAGDMKTSSKLNVTNMPA